MNLSEKKLLEGKWLLVKNADSYTVPTIAILEFNGDNKTLYDFDKVQETASAKQNDFQFIDENRLEYTCDDLTVYYVRLLPTQTNLSDSEIEKLKFDFFWNNEKVKVVFNEELSMPGMTEIMKTKEVEKIRLERIDSTLFLSFYRFGTREMVLPIKKATPDFLEVYGFYRAPFYVTSN